MQQKPIRNGLAATGAVLVLALFAFGALGFSGGASAVTSEYVAPHALVAKAKLKPKAKAVVKKAVVKTKAAVKKKAPAKKRR